MQGLNQKREGSAPQSAAFAPSTTASNLAHKPAHPGWRYAISLLSLCVPALGAALIVGGLHLQLGAKPVPDHDLLTRVEMLRNAQAKDALRQAGLVGAVGVAPRADSDLPSM
jgi:hypothetical protein